MDSMEVCPDYSGSVLSPAVHQAMPVPRQTTTPCCHSLTPASKSVDRFSCRIVRQIRLSPCLSKRLGICLPPKLPRSVSQSPSEEGCQRDKLVFKMKASDLIHQQDCGHYATIANTQDLVTFKVAFVEKDEMGLTSSTARDEENCQCHS